MFRNTVLGLGAALILSLAVAPTAAFAKGGHHGGGHHGGHHGGFGGGFYSGGYGGGNCFVKRIKIWDEDFGGFYVKKKVICY